MCVCISKYPYVGISEILVYLRDSAHVSVCKLLFVYNHTNIHTCLNYLHGYIMYSSVTGSLSKNLNLNMHAMKKMITYIH